MCLRQETRKAREFDGRHNSRSKSSTVANAGHEFEKELQLPGYSMNNFRGPF
jgi:hypothetical protein